MNTGKDVAYSKALPQQVFGGSEDSYETPHRTAYLRAHIRTQDIENEDEG
jgi:hypothetical protein